MMLFLMDNVFLTYFNLINPYGYRVIPFPPTIK